MRPITEPSTMHATPMTRKVALREPPRKAGLTAAKRKSSPASKKPNLTMFVPVMPPLPQPDCDAVRLTTYGSVAGVEPARHKHHFLTPAPAPAGTRALAAGAPGNCSRLLCGSQ